MVTAVMQKLNAEPLSAESFARKISSILGYD
jgi:hypothetical protein